MSNTINQEEINKKNEELRLRKEKPKEKEEKLGREKRKRLSSIWTWIINIKLRYVVIPLTVFTTIVYILYFLVKFLIQSGTNSYTETTLSIIIFTFSTGVASYYLVRFLYFSGTLDLPDTANSQSTFGVGITIANVDSITKSINVLENMSNGVQVYIKQARKYSAVSLTMGISGSFISVLIFFWTTNLHGMYSGGTTFWEKIPHSTPIIIITQVFSYFFLKSYRSSIVDLKYYQNEQTNLKAKATALKVALFMNYSQKAEAIIENLGNTERNPQKAENEDSPKTKKEKEKESNNQLVNMVKDTLNSFTEAVNSLKSMVTKSNN